MRDINEIIRLGRTPTIGYLMMSYDREHLVNAIIDCIHQEYHDINGKQRDDLKRLYITYQREKTWICPFCKIDSGHDHGYCWKCGEAITPVQTPGEFPLHLELPSNVVPFPVKQINSEGDWPALWLWKFRDTLNVMAAEKDPPEILIIFDEDDRYYPDYTSQAVKTLFDNPKSVAVWNHRMVFVRHSGFKLEDYNSAYGTMVGYRALIDQTMRKFMAMHPDGLMIDATEKKIPISRGEARRLSPHRRRRKKYRIERIVRRIGPLDGPFRRFFCDSAGKKNVIEGKHLRYYFFTVGAATYVSGRHPNRKEQCIDK